MRRKTGEKPLSPKSKPKGQKAGTQKIVPARPETISTTTGMKKSRKEKTSNKKTGDPMGGSQNHRSRLETKPKSAI